jgi:uncharacterized protein (TIGR00251 family)
VSVASELVKADGDGVTVSVQVQPRAGRTAVIGRHGDALKVRVAAPPVDDRANDATIALVAELFDVAPTSVEVVSGARSRLKRLRARGVDLETAVEGVERALERAADTPDKRPRRPQ